MDEKEQARKHNAAIDRLYKAAAAYLESAGFAPVVVGGTIIQERPDAPSEYHNELVIKFLGGKRTAPQTEPHLKSHVDYCEHLDGPAKDCAICSQTDPAREQCKIPCDWKDRPHFVDEHVPLADTPPSASSDHECGCAVCRQCHKCYGPGPICESALAAFDAPLLSASSDAPTPTDPEIDR